MATQDEPSHSLHSRPAPVHRTMNPFDGDKFERRELSKRLTGFIQRLPEGGVIAIDAQWGDGKTWFGANWEAQLRAEGFRTAYIDCFVRDYVDDPFLMIVAEIMEAIKDEQAAVRERLTETGRKLAVALLPAVAKIAANTAGRWLIGQTDVVEEVKQALESAEEKATDRLESAIEKRLHSYEADKASAASFQDALTTAAATGDKPIVVFLDELDRCRPDFAVRTIERIKHFFDVPGVVFVLLLNRKQLEASIEGRYGSRIDAKSYLGKFIPLTLTLPKRVGVGRTDRNGNRDFCSEALRRLGCPADSQFVYTMGVIASLWGLSLRDIEQAATLFSLGQPLSTAAQYAAWPIALKVHHLDLYRSLAAGSMDAHAQAETMARSALAAAPDFDWFFGLWAEIHSSGARNWSTALKEPFGGQFNTMRFLHGTQSFVKWLFSRFDLALEQ